MEFDESDRERLDNFMLKGSFSTNKELESAYKRPKALIVASLLVFLLSALVLMCV